MEVWVNCMPSSALTCACHPSRSSQVLRVRVWQTQIQPVWWHTHNGCACERTSFHTGGAKGRQLKRAHSERETWREKPRTEVAVRLEAIPFQRAYPSRPQPTPFRPRVPSPTTRTVTKLLQHRVTDPRSSPPPSSPSTRRRPPGSAAARTRARPPPASAPPPCRTAGLPTRACPRSAHMQGVW